MTCSICKKNKPSRYWGGKHICNKEECLKEAERIYTNSTPRKLGENYGTHFN